MNYKKKIISFFLSAVLALSAPITAFARPDWPMDAGIESEAGIVIDVDSGTVLFAQNIHVQKAPASITKILTALVVLEHVAEENLGDMVTFSHDAVYNVESGSGNKLNIDEGDQLSVEDCLYLLLLQSSNQAANALAEYVAGSRSAFVDMMNARIAKIGCTESHFANPSGLNDETQLVTAYDMALIAKEAYANPKLLEISSTLSKKMTSTKNNPNGGTVNMEHKMLLESDENYDPDAIAGKTGFTSIAGQTLVTYAKRGERTQISVTLRSTAFTHYKDTRTLLDFGFGRFQNMKIAENETWPASETEVTIGGQTYQPSELSIDSDAVITIPNDAAFSDADRILSEELPADHPEGAVALLNYEYNERKIGSAYVYSSRPASITEPSSAPSEDETEPQAEPSAQAEQPKGGDSSVSLASVMKVTLWILLGILALAAIGGGIFLYRKKKEEERARKERSRARRRRILEETGCSEEEFDRLLAERLHQTPQPPTSDAPLDEEKNIEDEEEF